MIWGCYDWRDRFSKIRFCSVIRYLTNEGIQYLRDFLHLPPEIVPATLKRATRPEPRPREGGPSDKRPPRGPPGAGGERQEYRYDFN